MKIKIYNLLIVSLIFNWFAGSGWELYKIGFKGEESIAIISVWIMLLMIIPFYWLILYLLSKTSYYKYLETKLNSYRKYFLIIFFVIPTLLLFTGIVVSSVFLVPIMLLNYFNVL